MSLYELSDPEPTLEHTSWRLAQDLASADSRADWTIGMGAERAFDLLERHEVHLVWLGGLTRGELARLDPELRARLENARGNAIAKSIVQQEAAGRVSAALEQAGVKAVLIKGIALARRLYDFPHQRPMRDIDVLVDAPDFERAVRVLARAGLAHPVSHGQRAHEQNLAGDGYWIDLHRDLVGTGRSRIPLGPSVLERRRRDGDLWCSDDVGTFLTLTVHLALTEYVTGRWIRTLDLHRWVQRTTVDWDGCVAAVQSAGLATACWTALRYAEQILQTPVPASVMRRLQPAPLRRSYLGAWLRHDPARLYQRRPLLARLAFQLPLHDAGKDCYRALAALWDERRLGRHRSISIDGHPSRDEGAESQ
jgi:hypothetical protein